MAQATITLASGEIEKSSVISFHVGGSINATDSLTLLLHNKRLYPKSGNNVIVVGDNHDYFIKFTGVDDLGSVFAIFNRDNKSSSPIMLPEDGKVNIPSWVLKKGSFDVGLYADGFASTPLSVIVQGSIVEDNSTITEEPDPTIVEQLLKKVDDIKYIKSCKVVNGKLIIILNDDTELDAGYVIGDSEISSIQSDQDQNDSTKPDYIKNRTHYKEVDSEGNTIYHTLNNKYLNLDVEVGKDSENPVTAKAVCKAIASAEPEALTNLEIEELLKNFM